MSTTCRATRADGQQCGAKTDGLICTLHLNQVRDALEKLPELLDELDTTISRQDVGTAAPLYAMNRARVQIPGVHYHEGDTTLPSTQWAFSWDAANVRWTIENTLTTWVRHIVERQGVEVSVRAKLTKTTPSRTFVEIARNRPRRVVRVPATTREYPNPTYMADLARWLLGNLAHIRADEAAPELWDEIRACHRDALNAIDRQTPDVFLGRCEAMLMTTTECDGVLIPEVAPCGVDLYCRTGDDEARCGACGDRYDVVSQQRRLDQARPDALGTPAVIAGALTTEDREVSRAALNRWIERDARTLEGMKDGPACVDCTHRTCTSLRAAEIQAIVKRHGRPLILRQGWDGEGRSLYRAGDVEARLAWNDTQQGRMHA